MTPEQKRVLTLFEQPNARAIWESGCPISTSWGGRVRRATLDALVRQGEVVVESAQHTRAHGGGIAYSATWTRSLLTPTEGS